LPDVAKRLTILGAEAAIMAAAEQAAFVRGNIRRWAAVVKASGVKAE
jgi:tripartite-type tricarboxylate transporter receptor subunit TctC